MNREQFEALIEDLDDRIRKPITDALAMADMDLSKVFDGAFITYVLPFQIDQIVLMGAGTRIPRVKAVLSSAVEGRELGNFLNTDEVHFSSHEMQWTILQMELKITTINHAQAIAMGAVYQSAKLSKSFKVLTFDIQEPVLFPVKVRYIKNFLSGIHSKIIFNTYVFYIRLLLLFSIFIPHSFSRSQILCLFILSIFSIWVVN